MSTIFQNQKAGWLLANQHSKVGVGRRSGGRGKQIANWAIWATIENFCVKVMYTRCLCSSQLTMHAAPPSQAGVGRRYVVLGKQRGGWAMWAILRIFAKVILNIFQIAISSSLGQPKQVWYYGYVVLGKQIGSRAPSISSVPHATTTTKYRTPTLTLVVPVIYPSSSVVLPITQLYSV